MTNSNDKIKGVLLTRLKIIDVVGGDVLHAMKASDPGYDGFGEVYLSTIEPGAVKAWRRHKKMTLNLVVPIGAVKIVIYDDRNNSETLGKYQEVTLSLNNYYRLTIPPMVWTGFHGIHKSTSFLINIANIEHQTNEVDVVEKYKIKYLWE